MNPRDGKIHVTWITTGLGSGGAEMMLCALIAGSDRARFDHSVISLTAGGKYEGEIRQLGCEVISLGMKPGRPGPVALARLIRAMRRLGPDVLMGWMYHGALAARLARPFAAPRAPVIANVRQSLDSLAHEKRGSAIVIRLLARLSRGFAAITYNSRRSAAQHEALGYDAARTTVIYNGIDPRRFTPSLAARAEIRRELGLPDSAILVGRIGRNHPMKDHATFLAAAGIAARSQPAVHFLLAGAGTDRSDPALAELADSPELRGRVHLLGERHDLPRLNAALDVACSSSAFGEGFPNVMAEAMACGVPCVATDVGDSAPVLGPEGIIVPPRDPAALAQALLDLLDCDTEERIVLGARLRERIIQQFTLDAARRGFERLLVRAAGAAPSTLEEKPCVA